MQGGSLLIHNLENGYRDIWKVEEINLGGLGEIGVVHLNPIGREGTIDGKDVNVIAPSNMVYQLIELGFIEVYDRVK